MPVSSVSPRVLGTGLALPTTATLAVVAVTQSGGASVDLAAAGSALAITLPSSTGRTSELLERDVQSAEQRISRGDTARTRADVITTENERRAQTETAIAAEPALDVLATSPEAGGVVSEDDNAVGVLPKGSKAWVKPVNAAYIKTSGFGPRWGSFHEGQDFSMPVGTPLKAMSSGKVILAGRSGNYGLKIEIQYWDGTVSYYGHASSIKVKVGDTVAPGQLVGYSGNTGRSTGPHLHLEIHPKGGDGVSPLSWLRARGISM